MKVKMVSKDMGARKNGAKIKAARKYSLAWPKVTL